ncbi:MAG: OsmC family protein [Bryobacteraceae bacterium]|nr:OsmC family protein [Bryobacteraceae bacterium]
MQATVTYLDGVRFEAESRGFRVICDQPAAGGGEDCGMSPPEFLLVSLGTCAGYYALQYLKTRSLPTDGLSVRVEATKALGPARLDSFRIEVQIPELEERHREGVLRAVKSCLVHNTLLHAPRIDTVLTTAVAAQS